MAWIPPREFSTGDVVTAEDLNAAAENTVELKVRVDGFEEALAKVELLVERARGAETPAGVAFAVAGAAAAATELRRPMSRRSLLFPWRKRD